MRLRAIDLIDVFVYLVVLGLFAQFFPGIITESFAVSLLTAVLFKLALEVIVLAKNRILGRIRAADTGIGKTLNGALLLVLSAGSKFLILWLTDVLFGDAVRLGGFLSVTLLIITLMLARAGIRSLFSESRGTDRAA